ncbi:hypothetical protein OJF2_10560 [Aquisphaera giovannonii]|uniref:DUF1559 domain-containing protein n=1 Tax=Aquisphaera giovannonii TaxID=406548 RepID=A0A5B9VWV0_9BACT|nr:DUF1559 domain-containing protein [Aquisphaera giovannonii]QEH32579.1 hypothetical protein OJF2_10560 [Aquisphaera giovannonii]
MRQCGSRGSTLVETLVVAGLVGLLAALMLPAVQAARESARRAVCANNLHQLGIAIHAYDVTWGCFPPASMVNVHSRAGNTVRGSRYSPLTLLLVHLEQVPLYDSLNFAVLTDDVPIFSLAAENITAAGKSVATFVCPSDPASVPDPYGTTNYRCNFGVCGECRSGREDGAFTYRGTRASDFGDGLGFTIAFSEKLVGGYPRGVYRPNRDWILPSDFHGNSRTVEEIRSICSSLSWAASQERVDFHAGRTWMTPSAKFTSFLVSVTPNSPIPDCGHAQTAGGIGVFGARSLHPHGVNVVLADGSVRFIHNEIRQEVWQALGTRAKNEAVDPF